MLVLSIYGPVRMKVNNTFPSISQELLKLVKHVMYHLKSPIKWLPEMEPKIEILNFYSLFKAILEKVVFCNFETSKDF